MQILDQRLRHLGTGSLLLLALLLLGLIGWLDAWTGAELSFSIFYLAPVALLAWYRGLRLGLIASFTAALIWLGNDLYSGRIYSHVSLPWWNAAVRLGFFVITAQLLARLHAALDRSRYLADHDGLTGLWNARQFGQLCRDAMNTLDAGKRPCALVYFDVDGFKGINDRLGHSVGDQVLQAIGSQLQTGRRRDEAPARLGGDEFVLLMRDCEATEVQSRVEALQAQLRGMATEQGWPIGFSIGVAILTRPPASADAAIALADQLMYRAKHGGKDRVCLEVY